MKLCCILNGKECPRCHEKKCVECSFLEDKERVEEDHSYSCWTELCWPCWYVYEEWRTAQLAGEPEQFPTVAQFLEIK